MCTNFWETFNNIATPFIAAISLLVYWWTLKQLKSQNSQLESQNKINEQRFRVEQFQSSFYELLDVINIAKSNFRYNNLKGDEGFASFRNNLSNIIQSNKSNQEKEEAIKRMFLVDGNGYSGFQFRLIFEMIDLIQKQDTELREKYFIIFGSTFSTTELIYIYNEIFSGILLEKEIPPNINKALWMINRHKIFLLSNGKFIYNINCKIFY